MNYKPVVVGLILIIILLAVLIFYGNGGGNVFDTATTTPTEETTNTNTPSNNSAEGDISIGVGQRVEMGDLAITFHGVTEDSRCATDVTCIWAGQVVTDISYAQGTNVTRVQQIAGESFAFAGHSFTIISVDPAPVSTQVIDPGLYVVVVRVANQ